VERAARAESGALNFQALRERRGLAPLRLNTPEARTESNVAYISGRFVNLKSEI
jgi:hypothetical protein